MSDEVLIEHRPPPLPPDQRVTSLIEQAQVIERIPISVALDPLRKQALEAHDGALASTVRLEANIYLIFKDIESLERYRADFSGLVHATDISYLRHRAQETKNQIARAGYLHAIALATKRHDDGGNAANVYLDAIGHYRALPTQSNPEAYNALLALFPMAMSLAPKYGVADRLKSEV